MSKIIRTTRSGIALFLFIRSSVLQEWNASVEVDHVGCGPAFMSNKGAVAMRLHLSQVDDDDTNYSETFTFVTAHLAAHAHNTARRNLDWRNIVERARFKHDDSIYDTTHLFV